MRQSCAGFVSQVLARSGNGPLNQHGGDGCEDGGDRERQHASPGVEKALTGLHPRLRGNHPERLLQAASRRTTSGAAYWNLANVLPILGDFNG